MIKVAKFGGTSTSSAHAISNVYKICKHPNRKVLVFSAIGKCNNHDTKLTDLLINYLSAKSSQKKQIKSLIVRKLTFLKKLTKTKINIKLLVDKAIDTYNKTYNAEWFISRGEFFTSLIMAKMLNLHFVPAENVIFMQNGKLDENKTQKRLNQYIKKYKQIVVPGFYYFDYNGGIKLFTRGGSDVSGAIIAKALQANEYENFTDICGIKQINPKIANSKTICNLSYSELGLITSYDAKVIHKSVAGILKNSKTKLVIRSIFHLHSVKTIVADSTYSKQFYACFKPCMVGYLVCIHEKNGIVRFFTSPKEKLKDFILQKQKLGNA